MASLSKTYNCSYVSQFGSNAERDIVSDEIMQIVLFELQS